MVIHEDLRSRNGPGAQRHTPLFHMSAGTMRTDYLAITVPPVIASRFCREPSSVGEPDDRPLVSFLLKLRGCVICNAYRAAQVCATRRRSSDLTWERERSSPGEDLIERARSQMLRPMVSSVQALLPGQRNSADWLKIRVVRSRFKASDQSWMSLSTRGRHSIGA